MGALSGTTGNILVVDRNGETADELSALICGISPNCHVHWVRSGSEAIRMSQEGLGNIILVAEELSDMTAQTFLDIVKCVKKRTPCILLSEKHGVLEKRWSRTYASFRVLKKPYDPSQLAYTLDCALNHHGLNSKIRFNRRLTRLLIALIPMAVVFGVVVGVIGKT
jgi:DNA-binding NtrC family response regulator